jgi:hypothetical protein
LKARANGKTVSFGQIGVFTFNEPKVFKPPAEALPPSAAPAQVKNVQNAKPLSKDERRDCLINWVDSKKCKNKTVAQKGTISNVVNFNALDVYI